MRINFLVNRIENGWEPTDKRLGGTEESIREWARELYKRGHDVTVYYNQPITWPISSPKVSPANEIHLDDLGSLIYLDREKYKGDGDVCINVKSSEVDPKEPTLYLTNETDATDKDLSKYLGVIWPSQWAEENIPVNNPRRFILPHGYDSEKIRPGKKVPMKCLYASSPDRGLDTLEQIWPSIVDQHPDAHLYITYGAKGGLPNATYGDFSEEEMNELYNTSDLWIHPCNGGELFGMSGIKAQAAGAIPVYFPTMALGETVKEGIPCIDARDMYEKLNEIMNDEDEKRKIRKHLNRLVLADWKASTDRLEEIIKEVLL